MEVVTLDELLELAAEIMHLDAAESSLGKGREWKEAKARYEAAVELFKTKRKSYVDSLLVKGKNWSAIPNRVAREIANIEAQADSSWHTAIAYTKDNIFPYLTKESGRNPIVRDVIKWGPASIGVVAMVSYLTIRLMSGVDVSAPIESRIGLQQRAAAAEKVIRYDDWMGTHVRRGGWAKGILLWPIEPTEGEISAAAEFAGMVLGGYDALIQKEEICDDLVQGYGDKLSKQQIEFIDDMAEAIQIGDLKWDAQPVTTIFQPIRNKFPCK